MSEVSDSFVELAKLLREKLGAVLDEADSREDEEQIAEWLIRRGVMTRSDTLYLAAREVVASIPATYDENDPMVQRHARALRHLQRVIA